LIDAKIKGELVGVIERRILRDGLSLRITVSLR